MCFFRASVLVLSMDRCVFAGHVSCPCRPRHAPRWCAPGTGACNATPLLARRWLPLSPIDDNAGLIESLRTCRALS